MPTKKIKKVAAKKTVAKKVTTKKKSTKAVVAKKAPAKRKVTAKKKMTHKCSCKTCSQPEEAFWVNEGPVINTLADLKKAINNMTEAQFAYHTKRDGNDFARWIRDCLSDTTRAVRVEKAKTRAGTVRALTATCCCE